LHCPRPDRLGDSRQALPAMRHRGQLVRLVCHFPVTHYGKLRRRANDFFRLVPSSCQSQANGSTWNSQCCTAARLLAEDNLQTVWRWRLELRHQLLDFFWSWNGASTWSSFSRTASVGPKLHPWPWVMGLCRMEARLLGKEYGGFLRRSCVSAIDFVVLFLLCVLITLSVLMQRNYANPSGYFSCVPNTIAYKPARTSVLVPLIQTPGQASNSLLDGHHN